MRIAILESQLRKLHFLSLLLLSAQLYVSTILASSLTYSASPIFFEFCVEIVYPIPEGIVGGFLTLVYNTFGMIFLFLFYVPQIGTNLKKELFFSTKMTQFLSFSATIQIGFHTQSCHRRYCHYH